MADTANTPTPTYPTTHEERYIIAKWSMSGNSTGVPIHIPNFSDKTVQIFSNPAMGFGGATVLLEGSMDERANPTDTDYASSVWGTLTDSTETAISTTSDLGPTVVLQNPLWIRARSTGGTATTVTVSLGGRK